MWRLQDSDDDVVGTAVSDATRALQPAIDWVVSTALALKEQVWSIQGALQLAVIVVGGLLAWALAAPLKRVLERFWPAKTNGASAHLLAVLQRLMLPILAVLLIAVGKAVLTSVGYGTTILRVITSLLNAWIVIQFVASFVRDGMLRNLFASLAWFVAALNVFGLLSPTLAFLDERAKLEIGAVTITALKVLQGLLLAILFLWIANGIANLIKGNLSRSERLTPSVRNLVTQGARIGLIFIAIMLSMSAVGIDLTVFAVFSGAIGVGIGFGLQSIFSNLMAGIILLLEKSVKVGDFIEFDNGLAAEVREINIRATLVTTNDNVDILVPNEEFIKARVINWTLREGFRRTRIPFGVAYGTDKDLVKKAALEAAENVPHMLTGVGAKPPQVWLVGFGDSSLDFELVVWLRPESVKRPAAVLADYNWAIEDALRKYGIEIPFPQRDLHIRSGLHRGGNGGSKEA